MLRRVIGPAREVSLGSRLIVVEALQALLVFASSWGGRDPRESGDRVFVRGRPGYSASPHVRLSIGRPVSQYAGNEGCTG
jgi:hypothetical protein